MANNSSVPYFNWFAEEVIRHKNIKFTFVCLYPTVPKMLDEMKQRECDCYWVKFDSNNRKKSMIFAFFALYRLFRKLKPNIVHTHLFDDSFPGLMAARLARVKKRILTKQDTTYHWLYAKKWIWADKMNNRNATHIHSVAEENKKFIIECEKANPNKVRLIRNGFPFDKMTDSKQEYIEEIKNKYQLQNRIVIGTVARLIDWKGHKLIIEAAKELKNKYPSVLFFWAGKGSNTYVAQLKEIIYKSNLENYVVFANWIERKMMPSYYKCLDVYLHPAINEPFGFAISEALMNKVPIIATKTGSTDLIEHKKQGYILQQNSIEDIINGVSFYLDDEERKNRIAQKGLEISLKHLSFDRMFKEHLELYKE